MCFEKTVAVLHLTFSIITAVGLYLSLPAILAWDSSKLQISTLQLTYLYIGYCLYWMVTSLIALVSLIEKRKQLLDIHNKICPIIIFVGISGFVGYFYNVLLETMDISTLDGIFRTLVLPIFLIIGIGLDICTSLNISKARKKMWIEPYSSQLKEHIYESNQNLTNEKDLQKVASSDHRKNSRSTSQGAKPIEQFL